ncbi:MAG: hypothetical protein LBD06_06870 [Candidatus Accumulibacter sp.]|nr:hypothetical protein [Accumulibacter sp.]
MVDRRQDGKGFLAGEENVAGVSHGRSPKKRESYHSGRNRGQKTENRRQMSLRRCRAGEMEGKPSDRVQRTEV